MGLGCLLSNVVFVGVFLVLVVDSLVFYLLVIVFYDLGFWCEWFCWFYVGSVWWC